MVVAWSMRAVGGLKRVIIHEHSFTSDVIFQRGTHDSAYQFSLNCHDSSRIVTSQMASAALQLICCLRVYILINYKRYAGA